MKFQNKLQFFFLILAFTVFTGQGLIHPFFHPHQETGSTISSCETNCEAEELEGTDGSAKNVSVELTCPICSSVTNKTTKAADIQADLIGGETSKYSQTCESFSFCSYIKPFSRGPPCV